jgi:peptidoglycan/LPS O-acetylase OafA/YrhL
VTAASASRVLRKVFRPAPEPPAATDHGAAPSDRHRLAGLDAVRGIAVLMVLGAHFDLDVTRIAGPPWVERMLRQWQAAGWSGVDLFFVLSGFLISGLLFREYAARGQVRVGRFLIRRGLKIYPSFWAMVFFTVLIMLASGNRVDPAELGSELLFVQNYGPSLYNYTWSLAVEEHFYLLLVGLIAWRAGRDGNLRRVVQVVVLALPVVFLLRCLAALAGPAGLERSVVHTHHRLDELAFGVALGYLATFHGPGLEEWVRRRRWWLVAGCALLGVALLGLPHRSPWVFTLGLSSLYLGGGSLLLLARYAPFGAPRRSLVAPLAWVGANSYAIYLWHVPVREWGGGLLAVLTGQDAPTVAGLLLYVVGAVLFGAFMTRAIERPALAWRDRHFP